MTLPPLSTLDSLQTRDPILGRVLVRVWQILEGSEIRTALKELHLRVPSFDFAPRRLREGRYFTNSCQSILATSAVIVNETFLLEAEAAIRAFGQAHTLLATPYLRSDGDLFGLTMRVGPDPRGFLYRLRNVAPVSQGPTKYPDETEDGLTLLTLFFVGHEIGHLLQGNEQRSFGSFLSPDAPLEEQTDLAVVRLCRHAKEFDRFGFDLPGGKNVVEGDTAIRRAAARLRRLSERFHDNQEKWFSDEASADDCAARLVVEHLNHLATLDAKDADLKQFALVKALFAVGLFSWYRDLLAFIKQVGMSDWTDSRALFTAMMDRRNYIPAASLFGDVHRFTLLRSALAIEAILEARTDLFKQQPEERSVRYPLDRDPPTDAASVRRWRLAESMQRYALLCILMDTAVKLAYTGCATGWMDEINSRTVLSMNFEPIDKAVRRLANLGGKGTL